MPPILPWSRRAAALLIGAFIASVTWPLAAQTLAVADLPPPPPYALDVAPPMNAAGPIEPAPPSLPVQFPPIREAYDADSRAAPRPFPTQAQRSAPPGDLESHPRTASPHARPLRPMPPRGGAQDLPGDPAALSKADRQRLREMRRNARREDHAFTGRLMQERDALETLYEAHPRPTPEAVGAIYGRIFAIQREMIEARVRRANALYDLFHSEKPKAPTQADTAESQDET